MAGLLFSALVLLIASVSAQSMSMDPFLIFNQTGNLPAGCVDGYMPGTDTMLYTIPYTYTQAMSVIGSFRNITWSGSPYDTVTLNGTDNTVGTARTYDISGAHVVETIITYSKPAMGPYNEVHTLNPITIAAANVSFYGDYDGTTATPICNGSATAFNFTINFCATNATVAAQLLHSIHMTDAMTVGTFLGGRNFSSCAALNSSAGGTSAPSVSPKPFTGPAIRNGVSFLGGALAAFLAVLVL